MIGIRVTYLRKNEELFIRKVLYVITYNNLDFLETFVIAPAIWWKMIAPKILLSMPLISFPLCRSAEDARFRSQSAKSRIQFELFVLVKMGCTHVTRLRVNSFLQHARHYVNSHFPQLLDQLKRHKSPSRWCDRLDGVYLSLKIKVYTQSKDIIYIVYRLKKNCCFLKLCCIKLKKCYFFQANKFDSNVIIQ